MRYVVLAGDVIRGIKVVGPFETEGKANEWRKSHLGEDIKDRWPVAEIGEGGLRFSERQAIKHFDELLTRAQEICTHGDALEGIYSCDAQDIKALKSILRKISDEVVEESKKGGA